MIDLRSDILGARSAAAIAAFAAAAAEPPGFARGEDRQQALLEEELAAMLGFENALFLPTATLANQVAVRVWCAPGEGILADRESHIAVNEAAATAGMNSVVLRLVDGRDGHLSPADVRKALVNDGVDRRMRLIWLENSHNRAGGTVMPAGWMGEIAQLSAEGGVGVHVDGARLWHAAVATDQALDRVAAGAGSMTVALNKAVGAPAGALLVGSRGFIDEAVRVQRMFGALWRPVGMLAAAARAAVGGYRARVEADHVHARALAEALRCALAGRGDVPVPATNIVMLQLAGDREAGRLAAELRSVGVGASPYGRGRLRFVTHSSIAAEDIATVARHVARALDRLPDAQRSPA